MIHWAKIEEAEEQALKMTAIAEALHSALIESKVKHLIWAAHALTDMGYDLSERLNQIYNAEASTCRAEGRDPDGNDAE